MPNWFIEVLMVWNYRSRSYWLLIIGFVGFILLPLIMDWYLSDFHLSENMKAIEDVIKGKTEHRVDRRALIFLISTWWMAIKYFIRDRKKMLKHF